MIHYIIYSKNRAAQLDLLLQSIDKLANLITVSVIYTATSDRFWNGYQYMFKGYQYDCLHAIKAQQDFKQDAIDILQETDTPLIGFLTDDTVFYRYMPYSADFYHDVMYRKNCNTFSLRNGYNTQHQCHFERKWLDLKPHWEEDDLIMWDTSQYDYDTDFGRPISIDGNFFMRDAFMPMLIKEHWNDPRSLDGLNPAPLGTNMMSFKESVVVNIPVNLACNGYANNWGRFSVHTLGDLNDALLEGKRLSLEKMDFSNVWSSHLELELHYA